MSKMTYNVLSGMLYPTVYYLFSKNLFKKLIIRNTHQIVDE